MIPLTGYAACKLMTVRTTYLDAGLTNYPSPVPITADSDMGGRCRADGYDVRFTAVDGVTLLTHHRVSFAIVGGVATAFYWVLVDHTTSPATQIYCHYGKADATDISNMAGTWTPSYTRSWSLDEAYGTGAGNYKDRCGVGDLTLTDADGDSGQGDGVVGKCIDLNGDADYLTDADHADHDPGGACTIECWINLDATINGMWFMIHDLSARKYALYGGVSGGTERLALFVATASGVTSTALSTDTLPVGQFTYCVGTYDKTLASNRLNVYVDGALDKSANGFNEDMTAGDEGIVFGRYGANYINGKYDEVRYSKDAKSAAWIKFTNYALRSADGEWTWGAEVAIFTLAGSISGASAISGNAKMTARLAGAIAGVSSLSGEMKFITIMRLAGVIAGTSHLIGNITLSKIIHAAGSILGIARGLESRAPRGLERSAGKGVGRDI